MCRVPRSKNLNAMIFINLTVQRKRRPNTNLKMRADLRSDLLSTNCQVSPQSRQNILNQILRAGFWVCLEYTLGVAALKLKKLEIGVKPDLELHIFKT